MGTQSHFEPLTPNPKFLLFFKVPLDIRRFWTAFEPLEKETQINRLYKSINDYEVTIKKVPVGLWSCIPETAVYAIAILHELFDRKWQILDIIHQFSIKSHRVAYFQYSKFVYVKHLY